MKEEKESAGRKSPERADGERQQKKPRPETDEHPTPDIEHKPEPDAENLIPKRQGPGTL